MPHELIALNDILLKKSGKLAIEIADSISDLLNGLSKDDIKRVLSVIKSETKLRRIFISSFKNQEYDICRAIKEIFEEREIVFEE